MKKQRLILLTICLFCFGSVFFAQDTIMIENRQKFHLDIRYAFNVYTDGMNKPIQTEIKTTFKKYDFTGSEYDCQYHFTYAISLDSCGNIIECSTNDKFKNENLVKFSNECKSIINNSNWKIPNTVAVLDSTYFFKGFIFTFEISCDPSEVIFDGQSEGFVNQTWVYGVQDGDRFIYFDGFKIGCDSNNQNLKRKKKCIRRKK